MVGRPPIFKGTDVLSYIKDFIAKEGYSPSFREIHCALGMASPAVARYHLIKLRNEGLIDFKDNIARSITVK